MPPVIVLPTAYTFAAVAFSPMMAYPSVGSVLAMVPTSTSGICEVATAFGSVEPAVGALASPNRWALTIAVTSTVRAGVARRRQGPSTRVRRRSRPQQGPCKLHELPGEQDDQQRGHGQRQEFLPPVGPGPPCD
ncbi:MAG: hypothetical protein IPF84_05110 [Proteobacteria bacterium]|nr:hypothetical protein [Pseudomonadota bacterium]